MCGEKSEGEGRERGRARVEAEKVRGVGRGGMN